jgi:serine/threonine protein phosphatase PrpC
VNGSLAVSRSLGDFDFKEVEWRSQTEQLVSPEPEVYELERSPQDEFLIVACDGVWDAICNEDLCAFVRSRLQVCNDLREICNQVIDLCLYKVSVEMIRSHYMQNHNDPKPLPPLWVHMQDQSINLKRGTITLTNCQIE